MTQKRLRNPYFMPSGFTQDDLNDLYWRTPVIKQVLQDIKDRKRFEKHFENFGNPKISQYMKEVSVKQQRNDAAKPRKPKSQKLSEQIQYGYDICKWWGAQHA